MKYIQCNDSWKKDGYGWLRRHEVYTFAKIVELENNEFKIYMYKDNAQSFTISINTLKYIQHIRKL